MEIKNSTKQNFDFIFVVLCYRNIEDLKDFIKSATAKIKDTYKIIIVNSYYDEESKREFQRIASNNKCDFVNVPNEGYGYGNNAGIEHAKKKYDFDFLIVANPDIEFLSFEKKNIGNNLDCIIAPDIKTLSGKAQNPFMVNESYIIELIEYYGYKWNLTGLLYSGFALNKINRELNNNIIKVKRISNKKIYAAHGACIIFGFNAINKINIPFDKNMFLFCEEFHLAKLAKEKQINTILNKKLTVLHKEDGSVSLSNSPIKSVQRESFIYYYQQWNTK